MRGYDEKTQPDGRRRLCRGAFGHRYCVCAGTAEARVERHLQGRLGLTESNNPWRIAQTKSFVDTAAICGWDLVQTDAGGLAAKQVADVDSMIAQGIDVLFLPPREESPLIPAVMRAKAASIPTFLVDRSVDKAVATFWWSNRAARDFVRGSTSTNSLPAGRALR